MTQNTGGDASPASPEIQPEAAAAVEAGAVAAPETDANAAESSAAGETDAKERQSLLSVIQDAVKKPEVAAGASSTNEGAEKVEGEDEASAAKAEDAAEEPDDSKLPFHNHPRWQQVIAERNELRPRAEQFDRITGFMEASHLTAPEVAEGFEVMALLKSGDPDKLREALGWFAPRVQALRDALGEVLPDDLQAKVDDGALDADAAAELAATRAAERLRVRREKDEGDRATEADLVKAATEAANAQAYAVQTWEDGIRKSDPDYAKKAELVETTTMALVLKEGRPKTVEEAMALAKRAYAKVNEQFAALRPTPRPKDTTTPAGSSAPTTTQATTLRGVLEAALAA